MSDSKKIADSNFDTGAVRSADVAHLDFCSAPLMGLMGMLRVAGGGGTKYGRLNYMLGMPQHETLNHVAFHLMRYILGDRTEPHLEKVAWGALVAAQNAVLKPELCEPHMLGPGATMTPAVIAELERGKPERDAKRQAGEFEQLFNWTLADMPEVQAILNNREHPKFVVVKDMTDEARESLRKAIIESKPDMIATDCQFNIVEGRCETCSITSLGAACGSKCRLADPAESLATAWGTFKIKGRGEVEVDSEGFIVISQETGPAHYVDPTGSHPLDHQHRTQYDHLPVDWRPGSTNANVYGVPTRVEPDAGKPTPAKDEIWTVFNDGERVYFKRNRGPRTESHIPVDPYGNKSPVN
ncbi:hypothetical protein SAMN05444166_4206 [Singulisphaera sp. GP187]|uniref:dATP/dGTP diphosphohydrolase domain-containing protein n=1 Tax=Singulisphaera sp. GP187 TaxID=1882752 RepID=UPI00092B5E3C|nr:dATP/dGTP diphosphohydrolase domain-containing protein [Singulisphaera sp. GP187]SIO37639.1 hypothetical protein SAMN05444166_4206 [Singulisphaera sp. GP187]